MAETAQSGPGRETFKRELYVATKTEVAVIESVCRLCGLTVGYSSDPCTLTIAESAHVCRHVS